MEILIIQPGGAYQAALYFSAIPLLILLVVWLIRRHRGEAGLWLARRIGYMPLILLLLVYYGIVWRWLFYDQFYSVQRLSESAWELEYLMPRRSEVISTREMVGISADDITSISGGMTTTRIAIAMQDGRLYRSAQIARYRVNDDIASLHAASQQGAPADSAKPTR